MADEQTAVEKVAIPVVPPEHDFISILRTMLRDDAFGYCFQRVFRRDHTDTHGCVQVLGPAGLRISHDGGDFVVEARPATAADVPPPEPVPAPAVEEQAPEPRKRSHKKKEAPGGEE